MRERPADQEMGIVGLVVGDGQRSRRFEAEASVVARVTEKKDEGERGRLGPVQKLGHEGVADADALIGGKDGQGGDTHHLPKVETSPGAEDVTDDGVSGRGHQLESLRR